MTASIPLHRGLRRKDATPGKGGLSRFAVQNGVVAGQDVMVAAQK